MTRKVIFTDPDFWTDPPPKENNMTTNPFIDLDSFITLHLEKSGGLQVGLIPVDDGIAIVLTLTTDLGRFSVPLNRDHLVVLYSVLKNIANFTPEQYKTAYDQLLTLAQQEQQ